MSQKNYNNNNIDSKQLSQLFKEVQDIRYGRAKHKEQVLTKEEIKYNRSYIVDKRVNAFGIILGVLFLVLFATSIHGNYIFATTEKEKVAINTFEQNEDAIDIMNVISNNISELTTKEIVTKEEPINYTTRYIDNHKLPKGEEKILQPGKFGKKELTIIKTNKCT